MIPKKDKPKTITEYINAAPIEAQEKLRKMLECLRTAAPEAEESIKWGKPALSYQWILFQFPLDQPLPLSIIHQIAVFRAHESNAKGVKWM